MEQFNLRSIDDFDKEFYAEAYAAGNRPEPEQKNSLIPEISKPDTEPEAEPETTAVFEPTAGDRVEKYFRKPADTPVDISSTEPAPSEINIKNFTQTGSKPVTPVSAIVIPEEKPEKITKEGKESKGVKSKGIYLFGKIASIVLLAATVIVFILGCFVSIFLDNKGSTLGKYCFNTMCQDIEAINLSKGDLVISEKLPLNEYKPQDPVAVPAPNGENGCDVQSVQYVESLGDATTISTVAVSDGVAQNENVNYTDCYGVVKFYIPALGGIISFAMQNAILVCALFVLLAALWCLLLVVIEKKSTSDTGKKN